MPTLKTEDWKALRRNYLGASDAAASMGRSKWSTPLDVYFDKVEGVRKDTTDAMRRGKELEPLVRCLYMQNGHDFKGEQFLVSDDHYWMAATPDMTDLTDACLVQLKTASTWSREQWGDPGQGDLTIPADYMIQVQHEMAVCEAPEDRLAVLFADEAIFKAMRILIKAGHGLSSIAADLADDYEFLVFPIMRNDKLIAQIVQEEKAFWENHKLAKVPPADSSIPQERDDIREPTDDDVALFERARPSYRQWKLAESRWLEHKAELRNAVGHDSGIAVPEGGGVTWKAPEATETEVTDWQSLASWACVFKGISDKQWKAKIEEFTTTETKKVTRVLRVPRFWGRE